MSTIKEGEATAFRPLQRMKGAKMVHIDVKTRMLTLTAASDTSDG